MGNFNHKRGIGRTSAPFAIDCSGTTCPSPSKIVQMQRPCGPGSIEYIISGSGTFTENDVTYPVKAGDVFIFHEGNYHVHNPNPDDPWRKVWVQYSGPAVKEILHAYGLRDVHHIPDFNLSEDLFRIFNIIGYESDQEVVDREGPHLFLGLVQKIHNELKRREESEHPSSPAEEIRERIDSFPDGDVDLNQLCEEFHFSKQYLIRIFKKRYGITPHEYILNRRIAIAQSLLKKTNLSVKAISEQLHFCRPTYFSEFFTLRTGMNPLEFRKKYRNYN